MFGDRSAGRARSRREVLGGAAALVASVATATVGARAARAGEAGVNEGRAYALTRVTVIDATGAPPMRGMTVVVRGGLIAAVGRTGAVAVPPDAQEVDLAGKYVIPGLIDSHVHSVGPEEVVPPLYALTGVTTVREMRGEAIHHQWRDKIDSGALLGPRWIIGSPIIDGRPSLHTHDTGSLVEVGDAQEAREAVRQAKRGESDFVKVYSRLTPEAYFAIADESRRLGIPFTGHCPDTVTIPEAVSAGHRTIEHMDALMLATSAREEDIRRGLAAITVDASENSFQRYRDWYREVHPLEYEAVRAYDPVKTAVLFGSLTADHCAVTPTLIVHRTLEVPEENHKTEEWKYLPTSMTDWWEDVSGVLTGGREPEEAHRIKEVFEHKQRLVKGLQQAGARILAGTDTGNPFLLPGFALHDELGLLVESGLTPMQALQAATSQPAQAHGVADKVGTVERGKRADLVILDRDPLADIRNTRRIHALVVNGRLITPDQRERLLANVEEAARADTSPAAARRGGCAGRHL